MEPRPLLKTRYRVHVAKRSDGDHWSGGSAYHRGATCPVCRVPLLLLWDINCRDPRFPRRTFGPLERLPLYFCWGCVNDVCYQVVDGKRILIHPVPQMFPNPGPDFPYKPYPKSFERRPLALDDAVPEEIRRLVQQIYAGIGNDDAPELTAEEKKTLHRFFGHSVITPMCTVHHQLGGRPISIHWAEEVFRCPNPSCGVTSKGGTAGKPTAMKFVAGILNDPWGGLPMIEPPNRDTKRRWNYFVSVQFHVCDRCWSTYGCNRCD